MVLEYRVNWSYGPGSPGVSVLHGRGDALASADEAAEDMASKVAEFFTALALSMPDTVTFTFPDEVLDLDTSTGTLDAVWPVTPAAAVQGDQASQLVAAPAGAHITWRTPAIVAGRRLIGRTFVVPLGAVNYEANGTLNSSALASLQAAADDYLDQTVFTSFIPSVWSRTHGIQADATSATIPDKVTVLRSRRD